MVWHVIEGEAGCAYAARHKSVAIVVDALRASATAAMLIDAGAEKIIVVREVEEALALKQALPDALLFGERGGLPPEGFDCGNSPANAPEARGRNVVFTTTTGAQRLIAARDAHAVLMGTTVNAAAVAAAALALAGNERDVVLIPAGLVSDPAFSAQEDWVAASAILIEADGDVGIGADVYRYWRGRIDAEGIGPLFASAPHAEKLRRIGLEADVEFCARLNFTNAVPHMKGALTLAGIAAVEVGMSPPSRFG